MEDNTTIDTEMMKIKGDIQKNTDTNTRIINLLEALLLDQTDKKRESILTDRVIAANDSYETRKINNLKFKKARLFATVVITEGASAGLKINLAAGNCLLGGEESQVIKVSVEGSNAVVSDSFDIEYLSNFFFECQNQASGHTAKITNMSVLLYN